MKMTPKFQGRIEPLHDYILVAKHDTKSESRVIIPDTARQDFLLHRVVAVGPGTIQDGKLVEVRVRVGAIVLVMGAAMDMGGDTAMVRESSIIAVVHQDGES